ARRRRRSTGAHRALGRRPRPRDEVASALTALVDRVTRRLRAARRVCRTVVLRLRFADYSRATRSYTMPEPTAQTHTILLVAHALLRASMPLIERRGLTMIGIALANLADHDAIQLELPLYRTRDLDDTINRMRERFES